MRATAVALALALSASPAMATDVFGVWQSQPSDTGAYIHVQIGQCSGNPGLVCGKIIDAFKGDPNRRPQVVGRDIIQNMEPDGANAWSGGTIWAPDDDETYSSKMKLKGDVLEVSGCILAGLVCRGQDWTRLK